MEDDTALMTAAFNDDIGTVRVLINAGVDINAKNSEGLTALLYASSIGGFKCSKALIDAGADIEETDELGFNPILYAARDGHVEIAKELIKVGADINKTWNNHKTVLMLTASLMYVKIGRYLTRRPKPGTTGPVWNILSTSGPYHIGILNDLDKLNANNIEYDKNDYDTLFHIINEQFHEQYEIAKELINAGADIYYCSDSGDTALSYAKKYKHPKIVELIKEKMIDDFKFLWPLLSHDIVKCIFDKYI